MRLFPLLLPAISLLGLGLPVAAQEAEEEETAPVFELSPFEVSTDRQYGYRAGTSVSGTRTATAVKELPFSLQIVTEELIDDLKVSDLEDAIRFTPGVQDNRDNLGNYGKFNVRGIQQTYSLRNGFRRYGPNDTSAAAQVEVVKGPAGLLYGQVFPGGVVNVVSKKPLPFHQYTVEARYGSYGSYRLGTDFGGPLNKDKSLRYRVIYAYEEWDSFVEFYQRRIQAFVPSFSWAPTDWIQFTFEFERYIRNEDAPHAGMIALNVADLEQAIANPEDPFGIVDGPFDSTVVRVGEKTGLATYLPRSFNTNGPGTYNDYDSYTYNLYTDIRLADWLQFRSAVLYYDYDKEYYANFVNHTMRTGLDFVGRASFSRSGNEVFQTQNDFNVEFETGPASHKILLGVETYRDRFSNETAQEGPGSADRSQYYVRLPNPYNVTRDWALEFRFVNPIADFSRSPRPDDLGEIELAGNRETSGYAAYFTDQISLMEERLRLIAGARYERYETADFITNREDSEDAVTYQGGILYDLTESWSFFSSYSESFYRNEFFTQFADPSQIGKLAPPQRGEGVDLGFKFESPGGRWAGTISWFDLSQTDILINTRDAAGNPRQVLAGERTSTGVEFDFHFAPAEGWQILLNYAYTDAEDVDSGLEFPNVPEHQGSIWSRYEFTEGPFEGLYLGGGALYMGDRPAGNDSNLFEQRWRFTAESYVAVEVFFGRTFDFADQELEVQFNVSNLTDEAFIRGGQTLPAEPRRYTLSVTYQF